MPVRVDRSVFTVFEDSLSSSSGRVVKLGRSSFACLSRACAPPPVGKGGSTPASGAAMRAARGLVRRVKDIEKGVTKTISGAIRSAGGSMAGLKFRMKTLHSLARKIHDKALERGYTMDESAARIGDALRYTGVFSTKDYSKGIRSTLKALMKQGYKVVVDGKTLSQKFTMDELETHWLRGDAYNGVHAILRHPNGTKIEVQFHTPESFKAKMKNHALYEEFRKPSTPLARKKELIYQMVEVADRAPVPSGALSFGERIFRPAEELG